MEDLMMLWDCVVFIGFSVHLLRILGKDVSFDVLETNHVSVVLMILFIILYKAAYR
jgi:hypothetical protein